MVMSGWEVAISHMSRKEKGKLTLHFWPFNQEGFDSKSTVRPQHVRHL